MTVDALLVGAGRSGTTTATTDSGTSVAGDGFVFFASFANGALATVPADSKGNTYSLITSYGGAAGVSSIGVWGCFPGDVGYVGAGAGHTATINTDITSAPCCFLVRVPGALGNSAASIDIAINALDPATPYTLSSGTLAQADEIVLAYCSHNPIAGTITYSSSNFTIIGQETDTTLHYSGAVAKLPVAATTAVVPSFTTSDGNDASNTVMVIVSIKAAPAGPTINTQPTAQTAPRVGAPTTFTVSATTSGGGLTYQWQDNRTGSFSNVASGGTSASLTLYPSATDNGRLYRVIASDSNGSTTSSSVALFVLYGTRLRLAQQDTQELDFLSLLNVKNWFGIEIDVAKWVASELTTDTSGLVTATLNATTGAETLSATATEALSATLSKTTGAETLSATATEATAATLSATAANATLSSTATDAVAATLTSTAANETISSTATDAVAATLTATTAAETLSATATEALSATLTATTGAETLSSAVTEATAATLTATAANEALSSTATDAVVATLTATAANETLSSVADSAAGITATLTATAANETLSSTATDAVAATLSKTLANETLSATATEALAATLSATTGAETLSATATDAITASLSKTLANETLSSVTDSLMLTLTVTQAPTTLASTATEALSATLTATAANETVSSTATDAVVATLTATAADETLQSVLAAAITAALSATQGDTTLVARLVFAAGGASAEDVWSFVFANGMTAEQTLLALQAQVNDLYRIHGLEVGMPLVVSQTLRIAGPIVQTISEAAGVVTMERQP